MGEKLTSTRYFFTASELTRMLVESSMSVPTREMRESSDRNGIVINVSGYVPAETFEEWMEEYGIDIIDRTENSFQNK